MLHRVARIAVAHGALACALPAQRIASSVDLSGTNVWYADTIRSTGTTLSPALRVDWSRATLAAAASVSRLSDGGSSIQVAAAPSLFTPSTGRFTAELASSLGGSRHHDGSRTGEALGIARLYYIGDASGGWAGAGIGRTWDGVVWRSVRQGELGAWLEHSGMMTLATLTPVVVQDTIRYMDVQAALRYPSASFDLGLSVGARAGAAGPAIGGTSRVWGNVSAVAWVTPSLAIVGNVGSYPVDLTQGYPGGRFVSIALRVASRGSRSVERNVTATRDTVVGTSEPAPGAATRFEVRPGSAATERVLRVYAPSARSVELNGDFTQWRAVRLTRGAGGWWTTAIRIAPGTYQMNIRLDGGPWIAPPGLLTTRDEFGGTVGILTVE